MAIIIKRRELNILWFENLRTWQLDPPSKPVLQKYIDKKWYIQVVQEAYEETMIKVWIKLCSYWNCLSKIKEEIGFEYARNKEPVNANHSEELANIPATLESNRK